MVVGKIVTVVILMVPIGIAPLENGGHLVAMVPETDGYTFGNTRK